MMFGLPVSGGPVRTHETPSISNIAALNKLSARHSVFKDSRLQLLPTNAAFGTTGVNLGPTCDLREQNIYDVIDEPFITT